MCTKNDHMGTPPKNHDKETPETFNICNLPKYFFEGAAKENLWAYQRNSEYWSKPVSFIYKGY